MNGFSVCVNYDISRIIFWKYNFHKRINPYDRLWIRFIGRVVFGLSVGP
jgi:hypothetical protein